MHAALPTVFAFVACVVAGISSFGDGIVFLTLWSFSSVLQGLPPELSKAVFFVTLLPLLSLPVLLYAARHELRSNLGYAALLSLSSLATIPLGSLALLKGDAFTVKLLIGLILAAFAVVSLLTSMHEWGVEREVRRRAGGGTAGGGGEEAGARMLRASSTPGLGSPQVDDTALLLDSSASSTPGSGGSASAGGGYGSMGATVGAAATVDGATWATPVPPAAGTSGEQSGTSPEPVLGSSPPPAPASCARRVRAALARAFPLPPISYKYSPRTTAWALFATGFFSGTLGGLIGSGGPPQIIAFGILKPDKSSIRGIKVLATTASNVMRLVIFAVAGTEVFSDEPWWQFLTIGAASVAGAAAGTRLRRYFNTDAVLRTLYVLLFLSTAHMLSALESTGPAIAFGATGAVVGLICTALVTRPAWFVGCVLRPAGRAWEAAWAARCLCCCGCCGGRGK